MACARAALLVNTTELLRQPGSRAPRRAVGAAGRASTIDDPRLSGDVAVDVTLVSTIDDIVVTGQPRAWRGPTSAGAACSPLADDARRRRRRALRRGRPDRSPPRRSRGVPDRARPDRPRPDGARGGPARPSPTPRCAGPTAPACARRAAPTATSARAAATPTSATTAGPPSTSSAERTDPLRRARDPRVSSRGGSPCTRAYDTRLGVRTGPAALSRR